MGTDPSSFSAGSLNPMADRAEICVEIIQAEDAQVTVTSHFAVLRALSIKVDGRLHFYPCVGSYEPRVAQMRKAKNLDFGNKRLNDRDVKAVACLLHESAPLQKLKLDENTGISASGLGALGKAIVTPGCQLKE